jgi:hypothetical protein
VLYFDLTIIGECKKNYGWWVGFGCGWAKLNVVFLCRQVRWQNTSFNFAKRWHFFHVIFCRLDVGLSVFLQ